MSHQPPPHPPSTSDADTRQSPDLTHSSALKDENEKESLAISSQTITEHPIPPQVLLAINTLHLQRKSVVVMTCGIAGSGKSTLARTLACHHGFVRLSIDKYILENHGVYNIDYPPTKLGELQDEAETFIKGEMERLLRQQPISIRTGSQHKQEDEECKGQTTNQTSTRDERRDIVLDLSLYLKEDRDFYREMVQVVGGGKWGDVLVFFKPKSTTLEEKESVLWGRIEGRERDLIERKKERNGKGKGKGREGMPVSKELLGCFLEGFEWPDGEGEVLVDVV